MLELSRYIVLNPVRASMVNSPGEWLWSNWHCMVGRVESPKWLTTDSTLKYFSTNKAQAIANYVDFVGAGVNKNI